MKGRGEKKQREINFWNLLPITWTGIGGFCFGGNISPKINYVDQPLECPQGGRNHPTGTGVKIKEKRFPAK